MNRKKEIEPDRGRPTGKTGRKKLLVLRVSDFVSRNPPSGRHKYP